MSKARSRTLYLISLGLAIVAGILFAVSISSNVSSGTYSTDTSTAIVSSPLFIVAIIVVAIASVLSIIAWIGALIRTAQLGRWGWFVCLILFSGITMLIYIFAGPETPAMAVPPPGVRNY